MRKFYIWCFWLIVNLMILGVIGVGYLFYTNSKDLPSYSQLENYQPPIVTRFYSADGKLLEEYAKEHRVFLPIESIPPMVSNAFIAAEDQNFYTHPGIDFTGILRAVIKNILAMSQGKKNLVGGSTITQQVVKNFLLTNEKSLNRKIKEAILSFRITNAMPKSKILELYLNEIFLGARSYGVASAALNYFNKSVNELNLQEAAFLASLPQAPSHYNPNKNMERVLSRRNWVIERMYDEGFVTKEEALAAIAEPIKLINRDREEVAKADFFAEEVRRTIAKMYGDQSLYEGGLVVKTSLNPKLEKMAEKSLRNGLVNYDQKYGYRGAITNIDLKDWQKTLPSINPANMNIAPWRYAVVLNVTDQAAKIGLADGKEGTLNLAASSWALRNKKLASLYKPGDVIIVDDKNAIKQIPRINGAIVVMDPHTGRVLAMVGGYSFDTSKFNRATQAYRQPGSSFKPFVYLAALENGLTPSSVFDDSPIALSQGPGMPLWKPKNFYHDFLGPLTLRRGLELSRNTITVRIAQEVGIQKIVEIAKRFGINKDPEPYYSMVLGAVETTVLQLTNAYSVIANGGRKVVPSLIDKIQDRNGKLIYSNDNRECVDCSGAEASVVPYIKNNNPYVTDPRSAYQLTSILEGVVQHTKNGAPIRKLDRTIAGKTGTSNGPKDTWFIGYTPDLVVGVFVGYDDAKPMGKSESGALVAQPIFVEFMKDALADQPDKSFIMPDGLKLVRVDYMTGQPSMKYGGTIYEVFKRKNFHETNIANAVIEPVVDVPENEMHAPEAEDKSNFSLDEMQDDGIY